jgi:hypothetical protein
MLFDAAKSGFVEQAEESFAEVILLVIFSVLCFSHVLIFILAIKGPVNNPKSNMELFSRNTVIPTMTINRISVRQKK